MIYEQTLRTLTEDELSILFLIVDKFLSPLGVSPAFNYLKMLKLDTTNKIIDILQSQALPEKKETFTTLKNKLNQQ